MSSEFALGTRNPVTHWRALWLLACFLLAACSSTPEDPQEQVPRQTTVDDTQPVSPIKPMQTRIPRPKATFSVAAVGDMMIGTDYPLDHLPDDDGVSFLQAVTPWLQSADVTFGNLEGVLLDGGEPAKADAKASAS